MSRHDQEQPEQDDLMPEPEPPPADPLTDTEQVSVPTKVLDQIAEEMTQESIEDPTGRLPPVICGTCIFGWAVAPELGARRPRVECKLFPPTLFLHGHDKKTKRPRVMHARPIMDANDVCGQWQHEPPKHGVTEGHA